MRAGTATTATAVARVAPSSSVTTIYSEDHLHPNHRPRRSVIPPAALAAAAASSEADPTGAATGLNSSQCDAVTPHSNIRAQHLCGSSQDPTGVSSSTSKGANSAAMAHAAAAPRSGKSASKFQQQPGHQRVADDTTDDISRADGPSHEVASNVDGAVSVSSPIKGLPESQHGAPGVVLAGSNVEQTISYSAERIIGHGSFGVVFQASVVETGEIVAIKKVLQDKRFKNRELQIMRLLTKDPHSNIVTLKHCFYSQGAKPDELYLNLVLEYVPETVYSISRQHQKTKVALPFLYVKLYMYQLSRALAHIHSLGICHRDIKPQNLLVDPRTQQLKLCDFGSAKALVRGEPNVSYICSRYYRAPELIFGSTDYTTAIDIWSQGCVGAELLVGQPLFPGDSGVDQLVEIIKILGTPTREEISAMNSNYTEFKFPQIKACQWRKIFRSKTPEESMDFIGAMLAYAPDKRILPLDGCAHAFFDELRDEGTTLPSGTALPPLFDFTGHEMASRPELLEKLLPPRVYREKVSRYREELNGTGAASGDGGSSGPDGEGSVPALAGSIVHGKGPVR